MNPLNSQAMDLALAAIHAWGCYAELLGEVFLTRVPPVGQPMLKVTLPILCIHSLVAQRCDWRTSAQAECTAQQGLTKTPPGYSNRAIVPRMLFV